MDKTHLAGDLSNTVSRLWTQTTMSQNSSNIRTSRTPLYKHCKRERSGLRKHFHNDDWYVEKLHCPWALTFSLTLELSSATTGMEDRLVVKIPYPINSFCCWFPPHYNKWTTKLMMKTRTAALVTRYQLFQQRYGHHFSALPNFYQTTSTGPYFCVPIPGPIAGMAITALPIAGCG